MRSPRATTAKQRAFTVTELIVVILILGILVALLLPVLSNARKASLNGQCIANLKQLGAGMFRYATENNGRFPWASNWDVPWHQYLSHSDRNQGKYNNKGVVPNPNYPQNNPKVLTVFQCPANPYRADCWYDPNYAYNRDIGGYNDPGKEIYGRQSRMTDIDSPQRTVLLADAGYRKKSNRSLDRGPEAIVYLNTDSNPGAAANWTKSVGFEWHSSQVDPKSVGAESDFGRANILFADGHLEGLTKAEVKKRVADGTVSWKP